MRSSTSHQIGARLVLLVVLLAATRAARAAQSADLPADVHRVVFLGDSITYAGTYVSDVEAYFVTRHPDRRIEFINVGLSSETVSGLSEPGHANGKYPRPDLHTRLAQVLAVTKPDFVFACYGMNDGIYLPFDEGRFAKFKEGMQWLHEQVTAAGAKIVHITPPMYDAMKGHNEAYNAVLDRYSDWLLSQREHGWDVVDLHRPMNQYVADRRAKDPEFFLARDGVHPDALGHWLMAKAILLHLGGQDVADAPDAEAMLKGYPNGPEILKLVAQQQEMMKNAWLAAAGAKKPYVKRGLPLADALKKNAELEEQIYSLAGKK